MVAGALTADREPSGMVIICALLQELEEVFRFEGKKE